MDLDRVKDHHGVASREEHPDDAGAAAEQNQGSSKAVSQHRHPESKGPSSLPCRCHWESA